MRVYRFSQYFVVFILAGIFYNCQNIKKSKDEIATNDDNLQLDKSFNKVYIMGSSDDAKIIRYFTINNNTYFFGQPHKYYNEKKTNDSLYISLDSIQKPQWITLYSYTKGKNLNTRIFVRPNDTVKFFIKGGILRFTEKHANRHNFYMKLEEQNLAYNKIKYNGKLSDYKIKIRSIYEKKLLYLLNYQGVSKDFKEKIKSDLKFEYLLLLIYPKNEKIKNKKLNFYVNNGQSAMSLFANEANNDEDFFEFSSYFDNVEITDFKKPDMLDNSFFKDGLNAFINGYFTTNKHVNFSIQRFTEEKQFIQDNFEGELENYAIARMIREYNEKGFGFSKTNIGLVKDLMDEYENRFTDSSYTEKISELRASLDNFNFELPEYAYQTKLINPIGDTLTLKEVFDATSDKIKVIDFWATWCPPCIRQITEAKHFKNNLASENSVGWIYLSIDKDKQKWLKKTLELQEYLNTEHQYFVIKGENSTLARALKISGIPRYVVFDKKEKIVLDNAPRPSDSLVFKKIIDKINLESRR